MLCCVCLCFVVSWEEEQEEEYKYTCKTEMTQATDYTYLKGWGSGVNEPVGDPFALCPDGQGGRSIA